MSPSKEGKGLGKREEGTPAIFLTPLGEGDPGLDGGHVRDVTDERETLGAGGEGDRRLFGQNLFDEVETDTCKTQVEPCDAGKHGLARVGRDQCEV